MPLEKLPSEPLIIGSAVTVPDGRAGVVRFVYPGEHGTNLIVRIKDGSMLVVPADKCRLALPPFPAVAAQPAFIPGPHI